MASTYMRVMDQKVVVTLSIYNVKASNENQGLLMDIRKKDMINNITINMTFIMLEPVKWSPAMCETDCQLIGGDGQLIGQLTSSRLPGRMFHACLGDTENGLLLQQEGVRGPLHHRRQQHAHQHPSVKREAISKKNLRFYSLSMVPLPLYSTRRSLLGLKS